VGDSKDLQTGVELEIIVVGTRRVVSEDDNEETEERADDSRDIDNKCRHCFQGSLIPFSLIAISLLERDWHIITVRLGVVFLFFRCPAHTASNSQGRWRVFNFDWGFQAGRPIPIDGTTKK
jgi:hypothetical protein